MNTKYIGSKIIDCDLFLSCAAAPPLAKFDFAGFQPHPGRISLRLFRREFLSYWNALARRSSDPKLSRIAAAMAGEMSWLHFRQFETPERRDATLCLQNVSVSPQVP
jgi:hypothetical protein